VVCVVSAPLCIVLPRLDDELKRDKEAAEPPERIK
jgi:hypothetical protein